MKLSADSSSFTSENHAQNPLDGQAVNPEAERAVIAALFRNPDGREIIRLGITPDLFALDATREAFRAIIALAADGILPDAATISRAVSPATKIEIETSLQAHVSAANLPVYVKLLKNCHRERQVQAARDRLMKAAAAGAPEHELQAILESIKQISAGIDADSTRPPKAISAALSISIYLYSYVTRYRQKAGGRGGTWKQVCTQTGQCVYTKPWIALIACLTMLQTNNPGETNMATAIGYIRVSTDGQVQDGVSLDAQRAKIEAWALLNDYELAAVHVDAGLSGKNCHRPGLQDALADCRKGSALVVYSLSRLSRSVRDTMDIGDKLAKVGADLVSLSEKIDTTSAAGKMVFRLLAVMNEFERDQISERTKSALQHKKAQGGCVGTVNFGYCLAADGVTLVKDENEQKIIAAIRDYREAGLSLRTIVSRLNEQGYVSRAGKPLGLTQVARIANG